MDDPFIERFKRPEDHDPTEKVAEQFACFIEALLEALCSNNAHYHIDFAASFFRAFFSRTLSLLEGRA